MTERLNQARYRFGQIDCRCQTPQKPDHANPTATQIITSKSQSVIHCVPQRQHCFWVKRSSLLPTQDDEKPWACGGLAGLTLPRAYPHKGFCSRRTARAPSKNSLCIRTKSSQKCARVKHITPSLHLESHRTQQRSYAMAMAITTTLHPSLWPNDCDALEDPIH